MKDQEWKTDNIKQITKYHLSWRQRQRQQKESYDKENQQCEEAHHYQYYLQQYGEDKDKVLEKVRNVLFWEYWMIFESASLIFLVISLAIIMRNTPCESKSCIWLSRKDKNLSKKYTMYMPMKGKTRAFIRYNSITYKGVCHRLHPLFWLNKKWSLLS